MEWRQGSIDRRHHVRLPTMGGVVLRGPRHDLEARLVAVSATEIEVECSPEIRLAGLVGESLDVELRLDGPGGGGWLQFRGRVRHVRGATHRLVIAIAGIPPEFAGVIEANLACAEPAASQVVCIDSDLN